MERIRNQTIGWFVGSRSTATFRKFFKRFEHLNATFYTDDWVSYAKVIPADKHIVGKEYTIGIEQNNSNIRHFLGRMTRSTKVVSKSAEMVMATLKVCWYINEHGGFEGYQNTFLSIFG